MPLDASGIIAKRKGRGVFIDSNLMVLLLTGMVNPARIRTFKRTSDFTIADFDLLRKLVKWFGVPLYSTPHVLSQISDLTAMTGVHGLVVRQLFKSLISNIEEKHTSAQQLAETTFFERFGLADASIATVCSLGIPVITVDLELHAALASRGLDALNFNHLRAMQWGLSIT